MKKFMNKMVAIALVVAAMAGWSCEDCDHVPYDDTELKNQIAELMNRVEALENRLQAEVTTLTNMISGQVTIKSHKQDDNGNWVITLTDGTSFVVYAEYKPEALPSSLIYVMEVDGEKVWAVMGENGQLTPLTDAEGNNIPVVPAEVEIPAPPTIQTQVVDGVIQISIDGGQTWHNTGVDPESLPVDDPNEGGACTGAACANITDVKVNTVEDQWGDEVPASVTFTLADGSCFTVVLDGAYGFAIQYWGEAVDTFFLAPGGSTSDMNLWQNQLIDFIKEVPQGWKIEFADPDSYGDVAVTLTAPSAEAIASGAAVAEGTIKLIGVFEGGKTAIAKLGVTTEPFAEVNVSGGQVTVAPNVGVEQFVYGITPASEFTVDGVKAEIDNKLVNGLWSGWNPPYNAVSYHQVINAPASEVFGSELAAGQKYVLWAATVKSEESGWDYVYSLSSELYTKEFAMMVVEAEATKIAFNDIEVKIKFLGFDDYFGGILVKEYFDAESQLSFINGAFEMGFENTTYANNTPTAKKSLTAFPCADISGIQPATTYVFWVMPVEEGKTVYTKEDMTIFEWTTPALEAGGTITVTAAEPTIELTSISTELTATGAYAAYYKYYKASELPADEVLLQELLTSAAGVSPDMPEVAYNLIPGTEYVLAAVAVDNTGKYGPIAKFNYKTLDLTYNDLTVTIDEAASTLNSTNVVLKWNVTGGTAAKYIYYINRESHSTWQNNMGATAEGAAAYIALNPGMYTLKTTTETEAQYTVSSYYAGQPHVAVVVAVDENGVTSKAAVIKFTPGA